MQAQQMPAANMIGKKSTFQSAAVRALRCFTVQTAATVFHSGVSFQPLPPGPACVEKLLVSTQALSAQKHSYWSTNFYTTRLAWAFMPLHCMFWCTVS